MWNCSHVNAREPDYSEVNMVQVMAWCQLTGTRSDLLDAICTYEWSAFVVASQKLHYMANYKSLYKQYVISILPITDIDRVNHINLS